MVPLLVTVTAPDPDGRLTKMPCPDAIVVVPAAIVAALVTVTVPSVLPTSVSSAWMPWPCVEVSVTPADVSIFTEPAS